MLQPIKKAYQACWFLHISFLKVYFTNESANNSVKEPEETRSSLRQDTHSTIDCR